MTGHPAVVRGMDVVEDIKAANPALGPLADKLANEFQAIHDESAALDRRIDTVYEQLDTLSTAYASLKSRQDRTDEAVADVQEDVQSLREVSRQQFETARQKFNALSIQIAKLQLSLGTRKVPS